MKSLKVLISLALSLAIILSVGTVFAATDLGGGFYGHYLDKGTDISVSDGTLTATQNNDAVYNYIDTNNILANAGFEESTTTGTPGFAGTVTEGWVAAASFGAKSGNSATIVSDSQNVHSGKNAFKFVKSADATTGGLLSNSVATPDKVSQYNRTYTITGLEAGTEYIVSFWTKGNIQTSIQYRTKLSDNGASWCKSTYYSDESKQNDWELVYQKITAEAVVDTVDGVDVDRKGVIFFALGANTNNGYAYLDDVQLVTKAQAIANVEVMIENLDITAKTAGRAVDDIEQWIAKLGKDNISNYDLFVMKKSGYVYYSDASTLDNTGFEKSDSAEIVKNNTGTFKEITTGWVANYTTATMQTAEISNDAHSGNNALKISVTNNDTEAGKQVYYNLPVYSSNISDSGTPYYQFDNANTKYIVSAWVKGAKLRGGIRLYDEETATWQTATTWQTTMENDAGDKWTLYTFNVTTNSLGQAQWFINVPQVIDSTATVIIDDVQVLTLEENIALVNSLIDQLATLDKESANYARAKADIEAWLPVLDSADLNLKYDIVLNEKYNIITPNEGYTHLAQGDYIASVTLRGKGNVNRVYGDNITNIYSVNTELIDEYVTHRERVTVGAYGTHYMGVQLTNSAAINTVDIKDFSLKRVGDVNESGEIDIRDMVRMARGLSDSEFTVDELVADYDNSASFDKDDIIAIRNLVLEKDPIS